MRTRIALSDDLYPVEAFLNALSDEKFIQALTAFSQGHGHNPEDKTCDFPADLEEEDGGPVERFGYIEFWTYSGNQEVRISFEDFLKYVSTAVQEHIRQEPKQEAQLLEVLGLVRIKIKQIETAHIAYLASHNLS